MTEENLNNVMEFDHVVRVNDDGTVAYEKDVYAPTLLDDELDSSAWEFFTTGYSIQYKYSGPIMHPSEYIGGILAEDILANPGVYVSVIAYCSPDENEEDGDDVSGWAIVRLIENAEA